MSLTIIFREPALRSLARVRSEDTEAFVRIRAAIAELAVHPRPEDAVAWGDTGICRLHLNELRVLYEVDEEASAVYIINVGLTS